MDLVFESCAERGTLTMFDANEYSVICRRAVIDGESMFEARVLELPDIGGYGDTREEATEAAIEAVKGLYESAQERGIDFPEPLPRAPEEFSGRVTLRMSTSLHWQARTEALRSGASLNSFICEAIAMRLSNSGFAQRVNLGRSAVSSHSNTESSSGITALCSTMHRGAKPETMFYLADACDRVADSNLTQRVT